MKLTKNADLDKNEQSGYGTTGFDACSQFSLEIGEWGKNVVIFSVDNSSSRHTYEKKNDILILDKGSTDRLDDAAIKVEAKYSVNITKSRKKICLSPHYNVANRFLYAKTDFCMV